MKGLSLAIKSFFSILAILIGSSLIVWIIYNEFIYRSPDYQRPPLAGPLGIAPAMIAVGVYWGKQVINQLRRNSAPRFDPVDPHSSEKRIFR